MEEKKISIDGAMDYDYSNDILFFKIKDREYSHSIELLNYVIDIDVDNLVFGLQIFSASKIFGVSKQSLMQVKHWQLGIVVLNGVIELKLEFLAMLRNKPVKIRPILTQPIKEKLPNSEVLCMVG